MSGLFMPVLESLVVNVALPAIGHRLGAGICGLQWIVDACALTFAALMRLAELRYSSGCG